jgi:hypothetical protein
MVTQSVRHYPWSIWSDLGRTTPKSTTQIVHDHADLRRGPTCAERRVAYSNEAAITASRISSALAAETHERKAISVLVT